MSHGKFHSIRARLSAREPRRVVATGEQREAAVTLVLAPGAGERTELLFIRRAVVPGDPWSGQVAFPGGRRDPTDASLLDTAIRETREETGIALARGALLGELDDLSPVSSHLPQLVVRPFAFGLPQRPVVTPSAEVAVHMWVSCHALRGRRSEETLVLSAGSRTMPGYRVGADFIWGMTERILTPFLDLLDWE